MPIIAKNDSFKMHPEGQYRFVCADVYDCGVQPDKVFGGTKHQVRIVFVSELLDDTDPKHPPYEHSEWFNISLGEKSNLRKFLQQWRGKAFTPEELEGWDVEQVKGAQAMAQIVHLPKKSGEGFRASMAPIMKLPRDMKGLEVPKDFKPIAARVAEKAEEERKAGGGAVPQQRQTAAFPLHPNEPEMDDPFYRGDVDEDDDLPF